MFGLVAESCLTFMNLSLTFLHDYFWANLFFMSDDIGLVLDVGGFRVSNCISILRDVA